jgi:hypothetical protein
MHSYEVPELLALLVVEASESYLTWMDEEARNWLPRTCALGSGRPIHTCARKRPATGERNCAVHAPSESEAADGAMLTNSLRHAGRIRGAAGDLFYSSAQPSAEAHAA